MADYLSREAALTYFEQSQAVYYFGLIPQTHWLERMAALKLMCAPDDPSSAFVDQILQIEEWATQEEWIVAKNGIDAPRQERSESIIEVEEGDEFGTILRFTPASSTGLSNWIFHRYDPDYFPSVPHGHYYGQKQPKLDAYLGWIYNGSRQSGRESRKKIVALWNDTKFRDFARAAINYYLTSYPHYRGWRVPNPGILPRRRP